MNPNNPNVLTTTAVVYKGKQVWNVMDVLLVILKYIVLITGSILFLLPLVWTFLSSFKPAGEIFTVPIQFFPSEWHAGGYVKLVSVIPFLRYVGNTSLVVALNLIGQLAVSTAVAYGFARFRHPLNPILFMLMMATMMIPEQVTMIPQFLFYKQMGWIDTYIPLVIASLFGGAYNIFLMRQFMMTLPKELDESAMIDGCTSFGILIRILLPLCKPILITIAIFTFTYHWNDFLSPLIYLSSPEKYTLQIGIYSLYGGPKAAGNDYNMLFAASILALLPTLIMFALGQKHIMSGIKMTGALKG